MQTFGQSRPADHVHHDHGGQRPFLGSVLRGLRSRCPACGEGRLFRSFLKPVDHCEACGEDIDERRLMARPVATHCIDCKTEAEQLEMRRRAF